MEKWENLFGNVSPEVFAVYNFTSFCFPFSWKRKEQPAQPYQSTTLWWTRSVCNEDDAFHWMKFYFEISEETAKASLCIFAAAKEGMGRLLWYLGNWLKAKSCLHFHPAVLASSILPKASFCHWFNLLVWLFTDVFIHSLAVNSPQCRQCYSNQFQSPGHFLSSNCLWSFSGQRPSPWDKQGKRFPKSLLSPFH